ncbi:MAG: hypothetical protein QOK43_2750 [Acidimicrobiaceae bacterium]|nr:hypothetical protein [Acidimicrobiaceae bacterium]
MQFGLALPQYDFSVPGRDRLDWPTLAAYGQRAEQVGFHSLWLSDHIVWAIDRYGARPGNHEGYDPIPTLAALARLTTTARLGTLVLAAPIRPVTVLAKALTSLDHVSAGRLTVGIGAGWFGPDFELTDTPFPSPAQRLADLGAAIDQLKASFDRAAPPGAAPANAAPPNLPPPVQQPRPPIWVGGRGPRLVQLAAAKADGWNTCWQWTPQDYAPRAADALDLAPDPDRFALSVGLYTLVGEDEADLRRRFERLKATSPLGVVDPGTTLDEYRQGRLVGTVDQVREQVQAWADLGVTTLIACLGAVPFSVTDMDDLEVVAAAGSAVP